MEEMMINDYARQLMDAHGQRAIAEAAQRAAESERNNDTDEAKTWRRVRAGAQVDVRADRELTLHGLRPGWHDFCDLAAIPKTKQSTALSNGIRVAASSRASILHACRMPARGSTGVAS